jgi:hypothetical protein
MSTARTLSTNVNGKELRSQKLGASSLTWPVVSKHWHVFSFSPSLQITKDKKPKNKSLSPPPSLFIFDVKNFTWEIYILKEVISPPLALEYPPTSSPTLTHPHPFSATQKT